MTVPNDAFNTAKILMDSIVDTFAQAGIALPERRYFTVGGQGTVAHDCEQLTISLEQIYSGLPGDQAQNPVKCDSPKTGVFGVELVRCIPGMQKGRSTAPVAPAPEDISLHAEQQMMDGLLLIEASLYAAQSTWLGGGMSDTTAGAPQGQYQAMMGSAIMVLG